MSSAYIIQSKIGSKSLLMDCSRFQLLIARYRGSFRYTVKLGVAIYECQMVLCSVELVGLSCILFYNLDVKNYIRHRNTLNAIVLKTILKKLSLVRDCNDQS